MGLPGQGRNFPAWIEASGAPETGPGAPVLALARPGTWSWTRVRARSPCPCPCLVLDAYVNGKDVLGVCSLCLSLSLHLGVAGPFPSRFLGPLTIPVFTSSYSARICFVSPSG